MTTTRKKLRVLGQGQLSQVRGAGILLPALAQAKQPVSSRPAFEEISIAREHLDRQP